MKTGNKFMDDIIKSIPKPSIPPVKRFPSKKEYVRKKEKSINEEE